MGYCSGGLAAAPIAYVIGTRMGLDKSQKRRKARRLAGTLAAAAAQKGSRALRNRLF
jgi:hypothetical protein